MENSNRIIKFRAGDKKYKEMIKDIGIAPEYDGNLFSDNDAMCERARPEQGQIVLMQYTGLKDKNGVEIYEGDIVKYECGCSDGSVYKKIASVEYGEFNCSCCDGVYGGYFDGGDIRECDRYEVIGNVFENPDLLNK